MSIKTGLLLFLVLLFSFILRFYRLDSIPPALYTDEIDQGYNAYSIIQTGRDEHGSYFPVSFRSFGDWKPPLQTYLMIPFMLILGPNEWSVRLPSGIAGIISILLLLATAMLLFKNSRLALLSAFILSVSPWHMFQSRTAMLVMISLLFFQIGMFGFIKYVNQFKFKYFIVWVLGFCMAIYSYYGLRLIVPLTGLVLLTWKRKTFFSQKKHIFAGIVVGTILLSPLLFSAVSTKDVLLGRAKTVSIFYDQGVNLKKWELETQDYNTSPIILTRMYHNKFILYGRDIVKRYLSHFDMNYLFLTGDGVFPFYVPGSGILNFSDLLLLPLGLYVILTRKIKGSGLIWIWLFISILPAALTYLTPASNRTFDAVVPLSLISAFGFIYLVKKYSVHGKIILTIFSVVCIVSFNHFLTSYFITMPNRHGNIWGYGWKEAMQYVYSVKDRYNTIYISGKNGMPYIYYAFYNRIDPGSIQMKLVRSHNPDVFGFEPVDSLENLVFYQEGRSFKEIRESHEKEVLVVVPGEEDDLKGAPIHQVRYPDGKTAFNIYSF